MRHLFQDPCSLFARVLNLRATHQVRPVTTGEGRSSTRSLKDPGLLGALLDCIKRVTPHFYFWRSSLPWRCCAAATMWPWSAVESVSTRVVSALKRSACQTNAAPGDSAHRAEVPRARNVKTKAAQATFDLARPRLSICSTRAQLFRLIMEKIADRRLLARQDSSQPPCSCFRSLRVLLSQIPDFALFDKIIQMRDRSGFWKDRKQLWGPSWCIGTERLVVSEFLSSWDMTYFLGLDHFGGKTTASFYTSFGQPTRSEVRRCVCVCLHFSNVFCQEDGKRHRDSRDSRERQPGALVPAASLASGNSGSECLGGSQPSA